MSELRSREYLIVRMKQCREKAAQARDPGVQAYHLGFARQYEREAEKLWAETTASRTPPAGASL